MIRQPVYVGRIAVIQPHPNGDNIELIVVNLLERGNRGPMEVLKLVTGKHYREGDLGIWLPPGTIIPGWLSYQLWMHGKQRIPQDFEVRDITIRGVASPGLWIGRWYRNDKSVESILNADARERGGGRVVDGWIEWQHWQPIWKPGDVLDVETLERLRSSTAEQPVLNRQDVEAVAAETVLMGSNPAAGSTPYGFPDTGEIILPVTLSRRT